MSQPSFGRRAGRVGYWARQQQRREGKGKRRREKASDHNGTIPSLSIESSILNDSDYVSTIKASQWVPGSANMLKKVASSDQVGHRVTRCDQLLL